MNIGLKVIVGQFLQEILPVSPNDKQSEKSWKQKQGLAPLFQIILCTYWFLQLWLPTVQEVLQADWQELAHSRQLMVSLSLFRLGLMIVVMCFFKLRTPFPYQLGSHYRICKNVLLHPPQGGLPYRGTNIFMEREKGFEPSTPGLGSRCSATELLPLAKFTQKFKLISF